jgi:hypothetical protein
VTHHELKTWSGHFAAKRGFAEALERAVKAITEGPPQVCDPDWRDYVKLIRALKPSPLPVDKGKTHRCANAELCDGEVEEDFCWEASEGPDCGPVCYFRRPDCKTCGGSGEVVSRNHGNDELLPPRRVCRVCRACGGSGKER